MYGMLVTVKTSVSMFKCWGHVIGH